MAPSPKVTGACDGDWGIRCQKQSLRRARLARSAQKRRGELARQRLRGVFTWSAQPLSVASRHLSPVFWQQSAMLHPCKYRLGGLAHIAMYGSAPFFMIALSIHTETSQDRRSLIAGQLLWRLPCGSLRPINLKGAFPVLQKDLGQRIRRPRGHGVAFGGG